MLGARTRALSIHTITFIPIRNINTILLEQTFSGNDTSLGIMNFLQIITIHKSSGEKYSDVRNRLFQSYPASTYTLLENM